MATKKTNSKSTSRVTSRSKQTVNTVKAAKTVAKAAKKNPLPFIILFIVVLALGVAGFFGYRWYVDNHPETTLVLNGAKSYSIGIGADYEEKGAKATYNGKDISDKIEISYFVVEGENNVPVASISTEAEAVFCVDYRVTYEKMDECIERFVSIVDTAPLTIDFLELGNKFTGDSVYIKAGDTDILIDAGSRQSSAEAITSYLNQTGRVEDNKLEYVIATHEHQDHIAGFVGTKDIPGIFDAFECETIIDFPMAKGDSALYRNYVNKRDAEVDAGAKHFTALECYKESKNGAKRVYDIAPGIRMEILYQKFYEEASSDVNNYSVCLLLHQGENHYLFTGDLEKSGEASLVEKNTLPEVILFKGAHHGSYTANTDALLSVIKPKNVCICCCAGSTEYTKDPLNTFPAQDAVTRIGKYTEKVYVTTLGNDTSIGYEPMNGTIHCTSSKGNGERDFEVHGSNNDTILKETTWFKANRTWPSDVA